jgi:hypothetical protein
MAVILLLNYRVLQVQTYGVVDATAIAAGVIIQSAHCDVKIQISACIIFLLFAKISFSAIPSPCI